MWILVESAGRLVFKSALWSPLYSVFCITTIVITFAEGSGQGSAQKYCAVDGIYNLDSLESALFTRSGYPAVRGTSCPGVDPCRTSGASGFANLLFGRRLIPYSAR